jgi:hypothetical protein
MKALEEWSCKVWSADVRRTQAPKKAGCFSEASPLQIIFTSNPYEPVELVTGLFQ